MFKRLGFDRSKPPRGLQWRSHKIFILFTVGMGMFTDMFLYGLIVPVLPFMLKDRVDMPDNQIQSTISNLLAIYAAASVAVSPIAGILADKCSASRQLPFVLGLIILVFATVLFAVGQSVAILAVARFLQGASGSVVWTIGLAIVIETVGQENLGTAMGTVFSFTSVAGLLSPPVGGFLYAKTGYKGIFGSSLALIGMDLVLRVLMVEKVTAAKYTDQSPLPDTTEDQTEETPLLPGSTEIQEKYFLSKPESWITKSLPILLLFRDPALLTTMWIGFIQATLLGSFDATVPLVASEQFGFNSLKAGLLLIPLGGADFLLGPVFGWCVDRYGTKPFLLLGFTWLVPALVLLRLPTDPSTLSNLNDGHHIAMYACFLALCGVGLAIINSPALVESGNIVEKYFHANQHLFKHAPYAQLYGLNGMVWSAGLTVGPLIAGSLRETIGYGNMNAVLAGLCCFTALLSALFIGRKEQDPVPEHDVADQRGN